MHGFLEAHMGEKPALQPKAAIGPAVRAIAVAILAEARRVLADPERPQQNAVHDFRRAMKQWRALMRLLQPFVPDATTLRQQARDHARSLSRARDGQSALNAFDDLIKKTVPLSARSAATIRSRIDGIRGSEEEAVLTEELREAIFGWLDTTAEAVEQWPLDPIDFSAIAAQLTVGYREARRRIPEDWSQATAEDLHELRQRVVDHRYHMELVEPLGRGTAACGPKRPSGCAIGSAAARTSTYSSGSLDRISHWRIGARGSLRLVPNAPARSHIEPRALLRACSRKSRKRSAAGWRRCGSTDAKGSIGARSAGLDPARYNAQRLNRGDKRDSRASRHQGVFDAFAHHHRTADRRTVGAR